MSVIECMSSDITFDDADAKRRQRELDEQRRQTLERNKTQMDAILAKLRTLWEVVPDKSFGQLVSELVPDDPEIDGWSWMHSAVNKTWERALDAYIAAWVPWEGEVDV